MMSHEPPVEVRGAVEIFRAALASFPADSYRIVRDGAPTWAEEEYDYFVQWEVRVEPVVRAACPFDVWFVEAPAPHLGCAFGFDSVAGLARRLQLDGQRPPRGVEHVYVFGFEPIWLKSEQVHAIVRAVFEGQLEARYLSLFSVMVSCGGGLLVDVGVPHVRRRRFGKQYRYAAYADAR
jgi:hypothetical protein